MKKRNHLSILLAEGALTWYVLWGVGIWKQKTIPKSDLWTFPDNVWRDIEPIGVALGNGSSKLTSLDFG